MKSWLKSGVYSLSLLFTSFVSLEAIDSNQVKQSMIGDLDLMKQILETNYAPLKWKESHVNWNLENEINNAKARILNDNHPTLKKFHQIVKDFLGSTQDYHVQVFFLSTESASLPFTVAGVNGRYFVSWIDNKRFPSNFFPIDIGDELVKFEERPIEDVISELRDSAGSFSNPETDQSLAELRLTLRRGDRGDVIPHGPLKVTFKSTKTGLLKTLQLIWDYCPEFITELGGTNDWESGTLENLWPSYDYPKRLKKYTMWNPIADLHTDPVSNLRRRIGAFQSYIPPLGIQVWTDDSLPFYAYIYLNDQGQTIGYVRIPHYRLEPPDVEAFGRLMQFYQNQTDALVIDQVDNPGGLVVAQYAIASTLTDQPLSTPRHHIKITQNDVLEAYVILALLGSEDVEEMLTEMLGDISLNHQRILFLKEFFEFILTQWRKGNALTDPIHIEGVDYINPHAEYQYTKPIVMLINQLDFSGGDFLPAILQDNRRAILFGSRTAGAGGCVNLFKFPSSNGVAAFSYTSTIAERINKQPIENLGVTPDVEYKLTENDLQYGYRDYINAINHTLLQAIENAEAQKNIRNELEEVANILPKQHRILDEIEEEEDSTYELDRK